MPDAIAGLAAAEFGDVGGAAIDAAAACDTILHLFEQHPTAALYRAEYGTLRLLSPRHPAKRAIWDNPATLIAERARLYREFLAGPVATGLTTWDGFFLLIVGDESCPRPEVPVFAFQKLRGEPNLLLPDIDFLLLDAYAGLEADPVPLAQKWPRGVFAGSTTGVHLTHAVLDAEANARVRAFHVFAGSPLVDFHLPGIVQVAEAGVAERLRGLGLGGERVPWRAQLNYRFLLSMDGNGATCSRVVQALRSRSVLLKYQSDSVLFYFRRLEAWVHYIPTGSDAETAALIARHGHDEALLTAISRNAQAFCDTYLGRPALQAYATALLGQYAAAVPPELTAMLARRLDLGGTA